MDDHRFKYGAGTTVPGRSRFAVGDRQSGYAERPS
jgi:hypothetical protein